MDLLITANIENQNITEEGETTIPVQLFHDIVKKYQIILISISSFKKKIILLALPMVNQNLLCHVLTQ